MLTQTAIELNLKSMLCNRELAANIYTRGLNRESDWSF